MSRLEEANKERNVTFGKTKNYQGKTGNKIKCSDCLELFSPSEIETDGYEYVCRNCKKQ